MLPSPGHMDTALITDGSVASGSAATTRVSVGGGGCGVSRQHQLVLPSAVRLAASGSAATTYVVRGGSGVSRQQWLVLPSVVHMDAALLTDSSVDRGSATTTCISVGRGGCGVSR